MTIGGSAAAAMPETPPMQSARNSAIQTTFPNPFRMAPPLFVVNAQNGTKMPFVRQQENDTPF
jgi:hypothetical protein